MEIVDVVSMKFFTTTFIKPAVVANVVKKIV